jgi:glycerophosphoryl diester phosphodiesterase
MSHSNSGAVLALDRVVAIAHRGGSRLRPENTLAAFDHALSLGVDGLECDVHLSQDGEVVVIHDDTLDRTTDAAGPVAARTAADLARVDAGFRFDEAAGFPCRGRGFGVPRLVELLERAANVPLIVEIKGEDLELARRTLAVVRAQRADDRVILAGFSPRVLAEVRRLAPDLPTSASRAEVQAAMARSRFWLPVGPVAARVFQVPFRLKGREVFGARFVGALRRVGVPVQAWVIDDPVDMRRLIGMGVTGLISDRPDRAVAVAVEAAATGARSAALAGTL